MTITNSDENRRIVLAGLQRRNDRLDAFENEMISACNRNCSDAKKQRAQEEVRHTAQVVSDEERKARAKERLHAVQEAQRREKNAIRAVNIYLFITVGLLLLASATQFPVWAAITTALGLATILAARLYRIFVPFESDKAR